MSQKWTVSVLTKDGQRLAGEFDVKKDAVNFMMSKRAPKTPIHRSGRNFVISDGTAVK
jgi:hypothetical protein